MTPARTAEGHTGRRLPRIDIDAPTLRQRVTDDLRAHPGSLSRDVAERLDVSLVQASATLGRLRDRHHEVYSVTVPGGGYRWALVGVLFDAVPRPVSEAERAAPKRAGGIQRDRCARRMAAVAAHLDRPRSIAHLAGILRWSRRRVRSTIMALQREGRATNVDGRGVAGRYTLTLARACLTGGE